MSLFGYPLLSAILAGDRTPLREEVDRFEKEYHQLAVDYEKLQYEYQELEALNGLP